MKRYIMMVVIGLALLVGVTASQGEWRMRIHKGLTATQHVLAETDSLTFFDFNAMVFVTGGTFVMGDGIAECGESEHEVTLTRGFFLGRHEVTNQEYLEGVQWAFDHGHVDADLISVWDNLDGSTEEFLDLGDVSCEIQFDGVGTFYLRQSLSDHVQWAYPDGYDPSDHPVKMVSWYGAARYCDWLSLQDGLPRAYEHTGDWSCNGGDPYGAEGYRLPTDAEREYAAQFDDERIYPWGNEGPTCARANYLECVGWTTPVGNYPDAPQALGFSDMAGNVYEWCNDWFECYLGTEPVIDPPGLDNGNARVHRGGAWIEHEVALRIAGRYYREPSEGYYGIGFRIARTAE